MTRVKICGIRDAASARVAADCGADFLGFVFVEGVRRQLAPEEGAAIIAEFMAVRGAPGPGLVGLFANQPASFVNRVVKECRLDYVQLCGDEDAAYWESVETAVIKQIKVSPVSDAGFGDGAAEVLAKVDCVQRAGHGAVLDTHVPGHLGGTGRVFDWSLAREVAASRSITLAGGLTPENVGIAIEAVGPWAVDVSSGIETDGAKDHGKIRDFIAAVRAADGVLTP